MKCQHPGCRNTAVVDCMPPVLFEQARKLEDFTVEAFRRLVKAHVVYYCMEHCHEQGYCWLCGSFDESVRDLLKNPIGLCEQCRRQSGQMQGSNGS